MSTRKLQALALLMLIPLVATLAADKLFLGAYLGPPADTTAEFEYRTKDGYTVRTSVWILFWGDDACARDAIASTTQVVAARFTLRPVQYPEDERLYLRTLVKEKYPDFFVEHRERCGSTKITGYAFYYTDLSVTHK